jgi:hypothetical protein
LVIGHFPTKRLAEEAAKAFVAADHGAAQASACKKKASRA